MVAGLTVSAYLCSRADTRHCRNSHRTPRARRCAVPVHLSSSAGRQPPPEPRICQSTVAPLASAGGSLKSARETFGARLRAERERAGVSLDAIAQTTKIQRSLLVGLENNDVSRWPVGIFRRAFLRGYLGAIGLRSEAIVAEFTRLFPESGELPAAERSEHAGLVESWEGELRLRLAAAPFSTARRMLLQGAASVSDLCIVFVVAASTIAIFGFAPWPMTAVIGLAYYAVSVAWMGRTPGVWWFFREGPAARRRVPPPTVAAAPPLRIVTRQPEEGARRQATSR